MGHEWYKQDQRKIGMRYTTHQQWHLKRDFFYGILNLDSNSLGRKKPVRKKGISTRQRRNHPRRRRDWSANPKGGLFAPQPLLFFWIPSSLNPCLGFCDGLPLPESNSSPARSSSGSSPAEGSSFVRYLPGPEMWSYLPQIYSLRAKWPLRLRGVKIRYAQDLTLTVWNAIRICAFD